MKDLRSKLPILHRVIPLLFITITLSACSSGGDDDGGGGSVCAPQAINATIAVNWAANRDTDVNQTGGGYRVYHSVNSGFNAGDPGVSMTDVPYTAGLSAPTTTNINVTQTCAHYFRVQAYSALNNAGGPLSDQLTVTIPSP